MTKHVRPIRTPRKLPKFQEEQVVPFAVTGSGKSYKKAVADAANSAMTAYKKQLYGENYDYEDYRFDEVKYELSVTRHKVTWDSLLYVYDQDDEMHYVTAVGTATIKARIR